MQWRRIGLALATGAVTAGAFAVAGPVGAAVVGGGIGAVRSLAAGKGFGGAMKSFAVDGVISAASGGIIGGARAGVVEGGVAALRANVRNSINAIMPGWGGIGNRLFYLRTEMMRMGRGMAATGVASSVDSGLRHGDEKDKKPESQHDANAKKEPEKGDSSLHRVAGEYVRGAVVSTEGPFFSRQPGMGVFYQPYSLPKEVQTWFTGVVSDGTIKGASV